jgi:hypothetical protein
MDSMKMYLHVQPPTLGFVRAGLKRYPIEPLFVNLYFYSLVVLIWQEYLSPVRRMDLDN